MLTILHGVDNFYNILIISFFFSSLLSRVGLQTLTRADNWLEARAREVNLSRSRQGWPMLVVGKEGKKF